MIDFLRKEFGGKWTYQPRRFPEYQGDAFGVQAYSDSAARYDGDDNTFMTVFRRTDTQEIVNIPGHSGRTYSV